MYRIEIAPGEVTVFRTIEEIATGIRNGVITPRSRIFHAASDKWLPVDFHPHYKKALGLVTGGAPLIDTSGPEPRPKRPRLSPAASAPAAPLSAPPEKPAPRGAPEPIPAAPSAMRATWPPPPEPPPAAPTTSAPPAATQPPRILPAVVHPPVIEPPVMPPPVAQPPVMQPPVMQPPVMQPPVMQPPVMQPPVIQPPVMAPPVMPPPVRPPSVMQQPAEVALPRIAYPEVPAVEPEVHHPFARRRQAGRGPLVIIGAIVVALVGGYYVSTAATPASEPDAAPAVAAPAERDTAVKDPPPPASTPEDFPAVQPAVAQRPLDFSAPRPTGPVSQAWSSSAGALAPAVAPGAARPTQPAPSPAPAVAPPPAKVELALPALPPESLGLSTSPQRDSAAIKRILRAVGGEPPRSKPAQ